MFVGEDLARRVLIGTGVITLHTDCRCLGARLVCTRSVRMLAMVVRC